MTDASANGIVLCGIKHSGKSTIGAALSRRLNLPLVDLDREIELAYQRQTGQTLTFREIYRLLGNEEFRRREALAGYFRRVRPGGSSGFGRRCADESSSPDGVVA